METFALDISKFADKVRGREDLVLRKVSLDLHSGLVNRTPVDTGRARSNWNVGVNNVDPSVTEQAKKSAASVISRAQRIIQRLKAGDTIYITNNVEYIIFLEQGSSDQAPAGMLRVTLRNYPGIVQRSVSEAKRERP